MRSRLQYFRIRSYHADTIAMAVKICRLLDLTDFSAYAEDVIKYE